MKKLFLTYLLLFITQFIWSQTAQDEYIKQPQKQKKLNTKEWQKLRKEMIRESRGLDDKANPTDFNLKPQDVSSEENPNGDYYQYKEEKEDGQYSSYPNIEQDYNNEYDDQNNGGGNGNGNGSGSGGNNGYGNYDDHGQQYGHNQYHEKEENDKYHYGEAREEEEYEETSSNRGDLNLGWTKWLLLTILVVLVAYLIYQVFIKTQIDDKGKKVEQIDLDELAPTQISKSELEIRLEKALAAEDYRLAIRIYFIFIIKALSEKDWITWEKRKTNLSYLMEMRGKSSYNQFEKCVSMFEFSWYGHYEVDKRKYSNIEPTFKNLLKEVEGQK